MGPQKRGREISENRRCQGRLLGRLCLKNWWLDKGEVTI